MKKNLLIIVAVLGVLSPALAQYKATGDDGITASPKVRQVLDTRKATPSPAVAASQTMCCAAKTRAITASPRVKETLAKTVACCKNASCVVTCLN